MSQAHWRPRRPGALSEEGINVVDAMMWIVIASLLLALAVQAVGRYWTASVVYLMKNDIAGVVTVAHGMAIDSGTLGEDQIAMAVETSAKSPGVTVSWGLASSSATASSAPAALGRGGLDLASAVTPFGSAVPADAGATVQTSYVLVAEHPGAPNIVVLYFFSDVGQFQSGSSMVITDGQMADITGGDYTATAQGPTTATAPAPSPTATASPTADSTTTTASADPTPTATPTASATPTPSASPTSTQTTAVSPASGSSGTSQGKYPLCHQSVMLELPWSAIRNGFGGQGAGHKDDIIPPIPDYDFPGRNWDATGMAVFANGCKPL